MDDVSSYYNTLGDVMNNNFTQKQKAEQEVSEKHEQLKELLVGLGEPLLDDSLVEGFKYVRGKAYDTAKRLGRAGADKILNKYGLNSGDLENFVNEARKGNFQSPRLQELWEGQKGKLEGLLKKVQGSRYNPIGDVNLSMPDASSVLPSGRILPSVRLGKSDKSVNLDGDEEIERMSQEDDGAKNLYNYRKAFLKKQYKRLMPNEKEEVEQRVRDAKARGDYVSGQNSQLDNAEKAKNLKVRRDAINDLLDERDVPLMSHTERPKKITIKGDDTITTNEPIKLTAPRSENYIKGLDELENDNRIVNFTVLRQDIANGRGVNAVRIANKNVNLQKQEFFDNATLEQRNAFNNAENVAHTEIDNLGKTAPETAQAKLEATQNLIHQTVIGENDLNGSRVVSGLENKVGDMSDTLKTAGDDMINEANQAVQGVKSKAVEAVSKGKGVLKSALEKAGEEMAETDVVDGGTEGDPVGDIVGLAVGIGALVGGLYHKKEEAPQVIPTSTSIQLGAGSL